MRLAERGGFEPPKRGLDAYTLSRRAPSTTRTPLRTWHRCPEYGIRPTSGSEILAFGRVSNKPRDYPRPVLCALRRVPVSERAGFSWCAPQKACGHGSPRAAARSSLKAGSVFRGAPRAAACSSVQAGKVLRGAAEWRHVLSR